MKFSHKFKIVTIFVAVIGFSLVYESPVSGDSVIVSPTEHVINITPGLSTSVTIKVKNDSTQPRIFRLTYNELAPDLTTVIYDPSLYTIATNINFERESFEVPANTTQEKLIEITIPESQSSGLYIPLINVTEDSTIGEDSNAELIPQIAVPIFINLKKANEDKLSFTVRNIQSPNPLLGAGFNFSFELANTTSALLSPQVYIQILSPSGEPVIKTPVTLSKKYLGPGQEVEIDQYLSLPSLRVSDIGNYKAEILIVENIYGTSQIETKSFLVLPAFVILVSLLVFIILVIIWIVLYLMRRNRLLGNSNLEVTFESVTKKSNHK